VSSDLGPDAEQQELVGDLLRQNDAIERLELGADCGEDVRQAPRNVDPVGCMVKIKRDLAEHIVRVEAVPLFGDIHLLLTFECVLLSPPQRSSTLREVLNTN
jgi:hypothetical protein